MAAELTRWVGEASTSFCLSGIRVWMGSEKTSLGIGRRPCSKGSRRGRIREIGSFGGNEEDGEGDWSVGSVMALDRESERTELCANGRSLRNENNKEEKIGRGYLRTDLALTQTWIKVIGEGEFDEPYAMKRGSRVWRLMRGPTLLFFFLFFGAMEI